MSLAITIYFEKGRLSEKLFEGFYRHSRTDSITVIVIFKTGCFHEAVITSKEMLSKLPIQIMITRHVDTNIGATLNQA